MATQFKRIEECAEVLPGFALKARAEHEPKGFYFVLMAKDIKEPSTFSFDDSDSEILRMSIDKSVKKYLVKKGDVLFISRGHRNDAAVLESIPKNTVASATFYILRPESSIDSHYLTWCLNQLNSMGRLDQIRTGAGTPIIQRENLKNFVIPVPSLEKQQHIAMIAKLMNEEHQVQNALLENTRKMHRSISKNILFNYLGFK